MSEALHAPPIDNCIRWLWHTCDAGSMVQPDYSGQTRADLDRLFSMIRVVAGRAYTRTVEAIHFWSALHRAGVPVLLRDAAFLKERLQGTERVGIVPKGVIPAYCQSYFPGEQVESFMNLPEENRAQFAQAARWQRLEPLELL